MGKIGKFDSDASALKQRVNAHDKFGKNELNNWIFNNIKLISGSTVLDLGCGFGKQSIEMLKKGLKVVAVDNSQESLNELKKNASEISLINNLEIIKSDFDKMILPDISFDNVISSYAFYYSKNRQKVLSLIHERLKKKGSLFICGPAYNNNFGIKNFLKEAGVNFGEGSAPFMEEQGPKLMRSIFGNVKKLYFENEITFPNEYEVWKYWSSHNMYDVKIEVKFKENLKKHFTKEEKFSTKKVAVGLLSTK